MSIESELDRLDKQEETIKIIEAQLDVLNAGRKRRVRRLERALAAGETAVPTDPSWEKKTRNALVTIGAVMALNNHFGSR